MDRRKNEPKIEQTKGRTDRRTNLSSMREKERGTDVDTLKATLTLIYNIFIFILWTQTHIESTTIYTCFAEIKNAL